MEDMMGDLTNNFSRSEFACPCCGRDDIDLTLVHKLQNIRDEVGFGLTINSGVRCEKHNKEVGGVDNSPHVDRDAADIKCEHSRHRFAIVASALRNGITRIGIGNGFVHLDNGSGGRAKEVIWTY
jgi:uncharacterized protein YcbK (DUF882 family)